ncbi:unnamed protein product [Prorocentrum cordatum]|uniref:PAS domain-containing protein n=1 Tax=Prorocentrum cordatum TaxID=2364126 RepID=A0ABN9SQV3_9DINO|nr:unnamed protein product [Polarella glacialis]
MDAAGEDPSGDGARWTVLVALYAVWFALVGCVMLVRTAGLVGHSSPLRPLASHVGRLLGLCRDSVLLITDAPSDFAVKQVAAELQKRALARAEAAIPYSTAAAAVVLGMTLPRATLSEPRRNSPLQDVCMMAGCFTTLFLWAFPRSLTLNTLDASSSFVIVSVALFVSPVAVGSCRNCHFILPLCCVIVVSWFNTNIRLNLAWLCTVSMSACSTVFVSEDPLCTDKAPDVIGASIVFAIFLVLYHQSVFLAVGYEMECHSPRNELKAARSVLRGICDAVVELDSDFRLQDGSPQLVDMLLLNPQRPLLGEDIRSFLVSDQDRQKFTEQMCHARLLSEDGLASELSAAFHVSMKDSSSITLNVEVFCVRSVHWEGGAVYLVGIREFTDTSPILRDSVPGTSLGSSFLSLQGVSKEDSGFAGISTDDSNQSSPVSSSVISGALSCGGETLLEGEPAACIDVLSPSYSVLHCTPAFAQHVDTSGGLLRAMRRSQLDEFITWVQHAVFWLPQEDSTSASLQYPKRLHFKAPARARGAAAPARPEPRRRVTSALLSLDLTQPPDRHDHDLACRRHGHGTASRPVRVVLLERLPGGGAQSRPRCGTPLATAEAATGQLRGRAAPTRGGIGQRRA